MLHVVAERPARKAAAKPTVLPTVGATSLRLGPPRPKRSNHSTQATTVRSNHKRAGNHSMS